MSGLWQDIQYGMRVLLRRPSFTIVAVLVLTLAIGANVTIFSFIDTALLRPLPYRDPEQLVKIWDSRQAEVYSRFEASYPDYLDWKQQNQAFSSLAAYGGGGNVVLAGADGPQMIKAGRVSDNFFQTLGVLPLFGRLFQSGEDLESAPRYAVLSYSFWQRQFGGRRDVLGQSVTLNSVPRTIVGVLPKNFHFAPIGEVDLYVTLHAGGGMRIRRNLHWLHPVGRLKPGVSREQAQGMMNVVAVNLEKQYPDSNKELRTVVVPLSELITGQIKPILLVLLSAVGLLLLIACANVANLLLARSATRAKEFAIRSALGARRWRVIRQVIVEGTLLATVGTVSGIVFAIIATRWMILTLPKEALQSMPYLENISVDPRILLFAGGLGLLTALLFSLPPALGLSAPLHNALREAGQQSLAGSWRKFGSSLVVAEVAISAILLVASGLLLKSLFHLLTVDTGFNVSRLTTFYVFPDSRRYIEDPQAIVLHDKLVDGLHGVPGVSAVGVTSTPPIVGGNTSLFRVLGAPLTPLPYEANSRDIDPGYFSTLQAKLNAGRYFDEHDDAKAPQVVILNETLAKIAFGSENPIGKQIVFTYNAQEKPREVVGVVSDVHEGELNVADKPAIYTPFAQSPDSIFAVVVRSDLDQAALRPALERAVHQVDPGIVLYQMQTMEDLIAQSPAAVMHRYPAWLVSVFAMSALMLGIVGLYGVMSYLVSQRTREIGVRMALGAPRGKVVRLILGNGIRLAAIGIVAGVAGAVLAGYTFRSVLFGVEPWDIATLLAVAAILAAICGAASYVPALRASRLDPVKALRYE
ncbi:MAG TPA: ABC transporter permease [Candidatus Binatia bacterium]|nr:ABC transporter permease [Candidatus Binatia bacterium]